MVEVAMEHALPHVCSVSLPNHHSTTAPYISVLSVTQVVKWNILWLVCHLRSGKNLITAQYWLYTAYLTLLKHPNALNWISRRVGCAVVAYTKGPGFMSRPAHMLTLSLISPTQIRLQFLKLGHDRFLPVHLQFTFH